MEQYKQKLREIIPDYFDKMRDDKWKELIPLISQEVLDDAYNNRHQIIDVFDETCFKLESRNVKKMNRIDIKKKGAQADIAYKVNSDFSAFRIHVEPEFISKTVQQIEQIVQKNSGSCFVRNTITDNNCKLTDIIQYVFIYIPQFGYITELQIGHKFASYVFHIDSLIRDKKGDDLVDFWYHPENTDWTNCFYIKMRSKILDNSFDFDVMCELKNLFRHKQIDPVLLEILYKYC